MVKIKFGICFSKSFEETDPLSHIGKKNPVYLHLFELAENEGWEVFALSKKTYKGGNLFDGVWLFKNGKFERVKRSINIDLVFDWTGNLDFPPKKDFGLKVVDIREFKELCADKWQMYQSLKKYMVRTFLLDELDNLAQVLADIKTDWVVIKPVNGLKGKGVYVGPKKESLKYDFDNRFHKFIVQEFIDTGNGISGITPGMHDLRVVVVNNKVVWCHVRTPKTGTFKANVGQGGSLTEIDYDKVPSSIKEIVKEVSNSFYVKYDNPIFSIDFGMGKDGIPKIFEINDQIGFPLWEMKNREVFLSSLIQNFKQKLSAQKGN
jgi:glutathione synthase/RimK-type ligase-like ATP-grasp enzyme